MDKVKDKLKNLTKHRIVVFGATGSQGGSVIEFLLKDGHYDIRGVTRDANSHKAKELAKKGVQMVEANVADLTTFAKGRGVFDNCYGAFIVTNFWDPSSMGKELEQGKALVDAALACHVTHLQYSSLPHVEREGKGKFNVPHFTDKAKVEEYIRTKDFEYTTFPQPAFYFQNFQSFFPPKKESNGELVFSLPATTSITAFDVRDTGGVVVAAFNHPHRWGCGAVIPIAGEHLTPQEIVDDFNYVNKTKAKMQLVPRDKWAASSAPAAHEMADMFGWFDNHTYYGHTGKREDGIRAFPEMKTFKEWIKDVKFNGQGQGG